MAKTPQKEMVAHMLRQAGSRGVHTFELRQAYIANPSERIADLERAGWVIHHTREVLHGTAQGCRYVKVAEPDSSSPGVSVSQTAGVPVGPEPLDMTTQKPMSPYDYERLVA
jgi:hypothetical protein